MDLGKLKRQFRESETWGPLYGQLKAAYDEARRRNRLRGRYVFEDRAKGSDRLCIVLAGYKEYLYPAVLGRLQKYAPADMDICIMTSGLYSESMSERCKENGWSYLSTKKNNVSLVQNIAIHLFPKAEYIFKLDEDIFITEGYFENMLRAYHHAEGGNYIPGVMAPLIPINSYGNVRVLEKFGQLETYTKLFEKPKYSHTSEHQVYCNPDVALFFWGKDGHVASIDEMNRQVSSEPLEECACAVQFSIGAILFTRKFWDGLGQFPVALLGGYGGNIGRDEKAINHYCNARSLPLMVSENVLVGHLSYMPQNTTMKDYYMSHQEMFLPPKNVGGGNCFLINENRIVSYGLCIFLFLSIVANVAPEMDRYSHEIVEIER